jgi:predicted SAM-dependent methyltransferase
VEEHYSCAYNLGGGDRKWPGWISIDLDPAADIQADLHDLSMIESDSADAVAAIHVLEHFYVWEAEDLIREWKRILKPGGKMIIEVPCLDKIFAYIGACLKNNWQLNMFMTMHAMYGDPNHKNPLMTHKWGYTIAQLRDLLIGAGMRDVTKCDARYHFRFRDMRFEAVK